MKFSSEIKKLKRQGFKYLAKDEDGRVFAYFLKPYKSISEWICQWNDLIGEKEIKTNIPFLSWEDKEPYLL